MSSSNDYDKLSDAELHSKLKAVGYDLPISINRDFLVRKLQQAEAEGNRGKTSGNNNGTSGTGTPKKRLSLNGESFFLFFDKSVFGLI